MNSRRNFLKLGALFVPAAVAPTVAYSFLSAPDVGKWIIYLPGSDAWREFYEMIRRADAAMAAALLPANYTVKWLGAST